MFFVAASAAIPSTFGQTDTLVDVSPLAVGNQWRHLYTTYKLEPPEDIIFTDTGWVQHTVSSKQQFTDSTIWILTRIRNFMHCRRSMPPWPGWDTCYTIIDTTTIHLVEQHAGAHRIYVPASEWKDIFPFYPTVSDTTAMYRYRRVDSSGMVTIRMSEPHQFCAHSFLTTLQRGIGVTAIQCTLLRCTDFHKTNHTLLNYLVLSSPKPDNRATTYALHQNYPNPFNPSTTIRYVVGTYGHTSLRVYDLLSREVATPVDRMIEGGTHSVQFDAGNLPSGVYFYRLTTGSFSATRKMLLMK